MHRDQMARRSLAGMPRALCGKLFAAELRNQDLSPEAAAETISQVFGVSRRAAQLYIRSHPSWADGPPRREGRPGTLPSFPEGRRAMLVREIMTHNIEVVSP